MVFPQRVTSTAESKRASQGVAASVDRHARTIAALRAAIAIAEVGAHDR
jgi:hypothetical protein